MRWTRRHATLCLRHQNCSGTYCRSLDSKPCSHLFYELTSTSTPALLPHHARRRLCFKASLQWQTEPADSAKHFLINDALLVDMFPVLGMMTAWYFGRCCWSSSRLQTCKGDHFLKIFAQSCRTREGGKLVMSWRKLRILSPLDESLTNSVMVLSRSLLLM